MAARLGRAPALEKCDGRDPVLYTGHTGSIPAEGSPSLARNSNPTASPTRTVVHSSDRSSCPRHLVAWISAFQAEGVGSIPTGGATARAVLGGVAGLVTRADCESVSGGCNPRTSPQWGSRALFRAARTSPLANVSLVTGPRVVLEAERIGSGFLNRSSAGSTPAEDTLTWIRRMPTKRGSRGRHD